jgi:sigma-54 dependent transcriptional regulator, acetoin dehydrogenase operon transcriptional activator AcoR
MTDTTERVAVIGVGTMGHGMAVLPDDERPALRDALDRILAGRPVHYPVRSEILASWRRAASLGLRPDRVVPPYDDRSTADDSLFAAAAPVLTALGHDLADSETTVLLADDGGRIMARYGAERAAGSRLDRLGAAPGFVWAEEHVGTNGVGTALEQRAAAFVDGGEHFAELFTGLCCGGSPVAEPQSGRTVGVVAVVRRAHDASRLILTVARQAARDVERRLRDATSEQQRLLHRVFVRAERRTRSPLAIVARDALLTNAAAARVLGPRDAAALWSVVSDAVRTGSVSPVVVPLDDGRSVGARCEAVRDGAELLAVLVRLMPEPASGMPGGPRARRGRSGRARFGWESLSDTELAVADLAARGRTNRAIADALVVSPHTVDSHLRHIYTKLGISSRVELTRLVLANSGGVPTVAPWEVRAG